MNTAVIQKATTKGQITLPKAWRTQFKTSHFVMHQSAGTLVVEPLILKRSRAHSYSTIFNAKRDTRGRGVTARELLKILKTIDG